MKIEVSSGWGGRTRDESGYVEFHSAGATAVGEFRCSECGYGVMVQRELPVCPMCSGHVWEQATWSPFARAGAHESSSVWRRPQVP